MPIGTFVVRSRFGFFVITHIIEQFVILLADRDGLPIRIRSIVENILEAIAIMKNIVPDGSY